ncbi:MAG: cell division protein FtsZ [Gammaproteobacteria bacterium]|nr:cell division protein FtsZ [Gammaproteobacteria bacterium]
MFELLDNEPQSAVIKVFGVGGGGGNAVEHMLQNQVDGVEFICANTDAQALQGMQSRTLLQLGGDATKGLGAGADPEVGRQAALEDRDKIEEVLAGTDMLFITAGMGGGTGTGAAPVVAEIAKGMGILTVAVVTKPFSFEGRKRMRIGDVGIAELSQHVDSLITIPNEKLLPVLGKNISLVAAFKEANNVLLGAVQGIADLIIHPGMINVDFADVKTVMSEMGMAMMGTGVASGDERVRKAAEIAIKSPLLDDVDLEGARGILVNITASEDLSLGEFSEVGDTINEFASDHTAVVMGTAIDESMGDDIKVTVVVTGLGGVPVEEVQPVKMGTRSIPLEQDGTVKYSELDRPAIDRVKGRSGPSQALVGNAAVAEDLDYLDLPAFLRQQAD